MVLACACAGVTANSTPPCVSVRVFARPQPVSARAGSASPRSGRSGGRATRRLHRYPGRSRNCDLRPVPHRTRQADPFPWRLPPGSWARSAPLAGLRVKDAGSSGVPSPRSRTALGGHVGPAAGGCDGFEGRGCALPSSAPCWHGCLPGPRAGAFPLCWQGSWDGPSVPSYRSVRGIGTELLLLTNTTHLDTSVSVGQWAWTLTLWNPWFIAGGLVFGLTTLRSRRHTNAQPPPRRRCLGRTPRPQP